MTWTQPPHHGQTTSISVDASIFPPSSRLFVVFDFFRFSGECFQNSFGPLTHAVQSLV
jgi:hypothetical protein